jgi:uncharacterized membrane protein YfcA
MRVVEFIIGLLTGILSGFGIGGGSLLILYLTGCANVNQYAAGGINLLYFIFCAPAALVAHIKHHLIDKKVAVISIIAGIVTSIGAAFVGSLLDVSLLRRMFGVLLIYIGIKEVFSRKEASTEQPAHKK